MRQIPATWGNLHKSGGTPVYLIRILNEDENVLFRFSTLPVVVVENGQEVYYDGHRIKEIGKIRWQIDLLKGGGVVGNYPLNIKLLNHDHFDQYLIENGIVLEGEKVELYLTFKEIGDIELDEDTILILRGIIEKISVSTILELEVIPEWTLLLNKSIFGQLITKEEYPFSYGERDRKTTVFGEIEDAPGCVIDVRPNVEENYDYGQRVSFWDGVKNYKSIQRVYIYLEGLKYLPFVWDATGLEYEKFDAEGYIKFSGPLSAEDKLLVGIPVSLINVNYYSQDGIYTILTNPEKLYDGESNTYTDFWENGGGDRPSLYAVYNLEEIKARVTSLEGLYVLMKFIPSYTPTNDTDYLSIFLENSQKGVKVFSVGNHEDGADNIWGSTSIEEFPIDITSLTIDDINTEKLRVMKYVVQEQGEREIQVFEVRLLWKVIIENLVKQRFFAHVKGRIYGEWARGSYSADDLIEKAPHILESIFRDDLGINNINVESFDAYRTDLIFGRAFNEPHRVMDIIDEFGRDAFFIVYYTDKVKINPLDPEGIGSVNIGVNDILENSLVVKSPSVFDVFNSFELHYRYSYSRNKFMGVKFVSPDSNNLDTDGELYQSLCQNSLGKKHLEIKSKWINSGDIAERVLKLMVKWFYRMRKRVIFKTGLNLILLEPGDTIHIEHPFFNGDVQVEGFELDAENSIIKINAIELGG